jgi:hypothetical protein
MFPHQPLNGSLKYWSFFSYYSTYKTKILPHQPLNGSLKYWSFFFLLFPHRQNNRKKKLQYFNDPFKVWCGKIFVL